jgi:hypothetical protein
MPPKKEVKTCLVCCENFNKSNHKPAPCQYCTYEVCTTCAETYLINTTQDAHCMNPECRKAWNVDFMIDMFTKKFMGSTYKKRREEILFERERSLLPETQPYAESRKQIYEIEKEELLIKKEEDVYKLKQHKLNVNTGNNDENKLQHYRKSLDNTLKLQALKADLRFLEYKKSLIMRRNNMTVAEPEKRVFVRACPASDCKGFLSCAWKCGLCEVRVCSDCHEIKETKEQFDARHPKGGQVIPENAHVCKPENVETATLLKMILNLALNVQR